MGLRLLQNGKRGSRHESIQAVILYKIEEMAHKSGKNGEAKK